MNTQKEKTKEIVHIGNDNRCQTCFEAGKAEALSGEYCVKLIEQGKEIGKSEQKAKTKEIIEKWHKEIKEYTDTLERSNNVDYTNPDFVLLLNLKNDMALILQELEK